MTLNILVVEDNPQFLEDAKAVMADKPVNVDYAINLNEALEAMQRKQYDGVITDVFFPEEEGGEEEPNGIKVAEAALEQGIPYVMCTSTNHHGDRTEPINQWTNSKNVLMIDREPSYRNGEADNKAFEGALLGIAYLVKMKRAGKLAFDSEGLKRLEELDLNQSPNRVLSVSTYMDWFRQEGLFEVEVGGLAKKNPIFKKVLKTYLPGEFD